MYTRQADKDGTLCGEYAGRCTHAQYMKCSHTHRDKLACTEISLASSPGHSQILSRSRGEKSGEGLGSKLRHGPEMVDSVST